MRACVYYALSRFARGKGLQALSRPLALRALPQNAAEENSVRWHPKEGMPNLLIINYLLFFQTFYFGYFALVAE